MTNVLEFEARATIERQAREWLIRLDGDMPLSNGEARGLRQWLEQHPSHREELTRLSKFWREANILTELEVPLGRPFAHQGPRSWRASPRRLVAVTGTVLILALLVTWQWWRSDGWSNGVYETSVGQQKSVVLRDGSSVQLNTDSRAEVQFSRHLRMVRLTRGEALFSVAHDAKRPFEVFASQAIVRAVGTAFTVRVTGGEVNVTVSKGVVAVSEVGSGAIGPDDGGKTPPASQAPTTLSAGQTTTLQAQPKRIAVVNLPEPELKRRLAWQEGYLVFSGEPLSEVVAQVNRYSAIKLELGNASLSSIAFGGRFKIGDLDAVIDVLHSDFGIQSSRIDEQHIRLEIETARQSH